MRPPVREKCLDILQDLHSTDECRAPAAKVLAKWRPQVLAPKAEPAPGGESTTLSLQPKAEEQKINGNPMTEVLAAAAPAASAS